jgi:hypothetical protein
MVGTRLPAAAPKAVAASAPRWSFGFAEFFVISQTALPALLYFPGTQGIRLYIRIAPFAISLAAFAWCGPGSRASCRCSRSCCSTRRPRR